MTRLRNQVDYVWLGDGSSVRTVAGVKRMKDLREEVGTKACIVYKIEPDERGWTHGKNEDERLTNSWRK